MLAATRGGEPPLPARRLYLGPRYFQRFRHLTLCTAALPGAYGGAQPAQDYKRILDYKRRLLLRRMHASARGKTEGLRAMDLGHMRSGRGRRC